MSGGSPAGHHGTAGQLTLSAEEIAGDLPAVCARTGAVDAELATLWFARSPWWAGVPLLGLLALAAVQRSWGPVASWWVVPALLLPLVVSHGVVGQVPLSAGVRQQITSLRRRRLGTMLSALLLTWVAVSLWLIGSRVGGVLVLGLVLALYALAGGMFIAGRLISVGGRPEDDGGVTLTRVDPGFVTAVELRRTGHRP